MLLAEVVLEQVALAVVDLQAELVFVPELSSSIALPVAKKDLIRFKVSLPTFCCCSSCSCAAIFVIEAHSTEKTYPYVVEQLVEEEPLVAEQVVLGILEGGLEESSACLQHPPNSSLSMLEILQKTIVDFEREE